MEWHIISVWNFTSFYFKQNKKHQRPHIPALLQMENEIFMIRYSQKHAYKWPDWQEKRKAAVSFSFHCITPRSRGRTHSKWTVGRWRIMNHLGFWLGPLVHSLAPSLKPPAQELQASKLRNLGLQTMVCIKAIYNLSPCSSDPPRQCLAADPLPFIGCVLIAG